MSYFCFGDIVPPSDVDVNTAAWELVRAGQEEKLAIICGFNIKQKILLEMLALGGGQNARAIPFMVTANPLEDTSETLISPFGTTALLDGVLSGLGLIENWLRRVVGVLQPAQFRILMTDGYDINFRRIEARDLQLCAALVPIIRDEDDVPSVEVIIRSPSSVGSSG